MLIYNKGRAALRVHINRVYYLVSGCVRGGKTGGSGVLAVCSRGVLATSYNAALSIIVIRGIRTQSESCITHHVHLLVRRGCCHAVRIVKSLLPYRFNRTLVYE